MKQIAGRKIRPAKANGRGTISVWMSSGMTDEIATPSLTGQVAANMRRTGFKQVRPEHFIGVHQLKRSEVKLALRWFRQLGGF
jgi:predicted esterase